MSANVHHDHARHDHSHRDYSHHGHGHHGHPHGSGAGRSMAFSFAITLGFMVVEAVGGWLTGSLALVSDAGHMLTDAGALGLGLLALRLGQRPATATKTFGYRRVEILAALLNALTLWAIVGILLREAWGRFQAPHAVAPEGMTAIAAAGLAVNVVSALLLSRHKDENLNIRGAFLHVMADMMGSVSALAAGLVIWKTGWTAADPLASVLICVLILWSSWGLLRESVHILLLGVPPHIDFHSVENALLAHPDICCVYDLHIWSISSGWDALSAHLVVRDPAKNRHETLREIEALLEERYGIRHATLQLEGTHEMKDERSAVCAVGKGDSCETGSRPEHP